jgi:outer membrane receptor protein involved in Fe transport
VSTHEHGRVYIAALIFWAMPLAVARAQTRLGTVDVDAARESDAEPADAPAAFVTRVDAAHPTARTASVADLLEGEAGVRVRSRGGLGAFTSVSIRGAEDAEVAVLVDGVPLPRAASGAIDLGQLSADGLLRVDVYRGVPPVELGGEVIGGAINLITRRGGAGGGGAAVGAGGLWRRVSLRATAGVGSYGARAVTAGASFDLGRRLRASVSAAYRGAVGDFVYYDIGGTKLEHGDDHASIRRNNDFDQAALDVTLDGERGRARWRAGVHGFLKLQGVPGVASLGLETRAARLHTTRLILDGEWRRAGRRVDVTAATHFVYERNLFSNPLGEQVGPFGPNVSEGETIAGGGRVRADVPWGVHQLWSGIAEARAEARVPHNLLIADGARPSRRVFVGAALVDDVRLGRDRVALTPALRVDVAWSQLAPGSGVSAGAPDRFVTDVFPSPRLGVRAQLGRYVTLRANAGRFVRFPTLVELFGDGGFLLQRGDLKPESAWGGDAGGAARVSRTTSGVAWTAWLEAAFFGRRVSDAIAFRGDGHAASAVNIGDAQFLGCEVRAGAQIADRYRVRLDYTFLDTANYGAEVGAYGKELPGRARHQVALRAEWLRGPFRVFYEFDFYDAVFTDEQNYSVLPGHALHALGAELSHGPWRFTAEARNLADLRVLDVPAGGLAQQGNTYPYPLADFFNYPLPGRAIYATLAYQN